MEKICIYIIDWDSGLFKHLGSESDLNKLLTCYKRMMHNGQYSIQNIGISINIGVSDWHLPEFTDDILTIFSNHYENEDLISQFKKYIS